MILPAADKGGGINRGATVPDTKSCSTQSVWRGNHVGTSTRGSFGGNSESGHPLLSSIRHRIYDSAEELLYKVQCTLHNGGSISVQWMIATEPSETLWENSYKGVIRSDRPWGTKLKRDSFSVGQDFERVRTTKFLTLSVIERKIGTR
jgi:hypothetical protein